MVDISPLAGFLYELFLIILSIIVTAILGYIFRKKVRRFIRRIKMYLFNSEMRISLLNVSLYGDAPKQWLSNDVFKKIKLESSNGDIIKDSVRKNVMKIKSQILGMSIIISIEEDIDSSTVGAEKRKDVKIFGYKVVIKLKDEMRIGVRKISDLNHFISISNKANDAIRYSCFAGKGAVKKYFVTDIKHDSVRPQKKKIDKELRCNISSGEKITIIGEDITFLTDAVKKHFI